MTRLAQPSVAPARRSRRVEARPATLVPRASQLTTPLDSLSEVELIERPVAVSTLRRRTGSRAQDGLTGCEPDHGEDDLCGSYEPQQKDEPAMHVLHRFVANNC